VKRRLRRLRSDLALIQRAKRDARERQRSDWSEWKRRRDRALGLLLWPAVVAGGYLVIWGDPALERLVGAAILLGPAALAGFNVLWFRKGFAMLRARRSSQATKEDRPRRGGA
jgi:hypothetical protein